MGIEQYQLRNTEHHPNYSPTAIVPHNKAQILLVVAEQPTASEVEYLAKILATIPLTLDQVAMIGSDDCPWVELDKIEWVWFCGVEVQSLSKTVNTLSSAALAEVESDTPKRRELWRQIQSQKAAS